MEAVAGAIRVEELARRADVSVDTIRFYQKRQLLPPPRREGRVAWYDTDHEDRLGRIKELQRQGFSLAVIRRLLDGELDATDAPLAAAVAGAQQGDAELLDLDELATRVGIPAPLVEAVVREGLAGSTASRRAVRLHRRRRRRAALRPAAPRGRLPAQRPARARASSPRGDPRDRRRCGRDVRRARAPSAPGV